MKKKILILSTSQGHASIAEAIKQTLSKARYDTNIYSYTHMSIFFYKFFYKHQPKLFKHIYNIGKLGATHQVSKIFSKQVYDSIINKVLNKYNPDLIITTYFLYLPSLETNKRVHQPIINIAANARQMLDIELSSKIYTNCTFDEKQKKLIQKNKKKYNNLITTGWFIRDEFEKSYKLPEIRNKLKLDQKKPTLLFISGSEGTNTVISNILLLIESKATCQILVACGNNKMLFKGIKTLTNLAANKNQKIIPIGFTNKLHLYMQAADLIIGKAGPNSIFEAVATKTPFLATTHIGGQEDGNLEIIKSYKLGFVEENPIKAIKLIKKILDKPEELKKFQPTLKLLAKQNKAAKKKLVKIVKKALVE